VSITIDDRRVFINGGSNIADGIFRVNWLRKNLLAIPCLLVIGLLASSLLDKRRERADKQLHGGINPDGSTATGPNKTALAAVQAKLSLSPPSPSSPTSSSSSSSTKS
jgi:hypothetical protein